MSLFRLETRSHSPLPKAALFILQVLTYFFRNGKKEKTHTIALYQNKILQVSDFCATHCIDVAL